MFIGAFHEAGGMIECYKDSSAMETDVWLVEFDINGEIIDQYCYGGSYYEDGNDIVEVEGGYVILAHTTSNDIDVSGLHGNAGEAVDDFWVLKIDTIGNIIWQNCLGGSGIEAPSKIFKTKDNGFMVFGFTNSIDGDVVGNHNPNGIQTDIWVVKINAIGELQWQQCIGGYGWERILFQHNAVQIDDYNYALTIEAGTLDGDVQCLINPNGQYPKDAWIINIKDCSQYQPTTPQTPSGKDHLCVNTDRITTYTTQVANGAWYYEWELLPNDAGTTTQDSLTQIHWSPIYEGTATIKVRSTNDCGVSIRSDSLVVQTYMCMGTEEYETGLRAINVYPNPASSTLTVSYNKIPGSTTTIELLDMYGNIVIKQNMPVGKQQVSFDVKNIATGLYFVRVVDDDEVVGMRKIIVE